jgi:hypothetical protein
MIDTTGLYEVSRVRAHTPRKGEKMWYWWYIAEKC